MCFEENYVKKDLENKKNRFRNMMETKQQWGCEHKWVFLDPVFLGGRGLIPDFLTPCLNPRPPSSGSRPNFVAKI
jgi:hypothetical protein